LGSRDLAEASIIPSNTNAAEPTKIWNYGSWDVDYHVDTQLANGVGTLSAASTIVPNDTGIAFSLSPAGTGFSYVASDLPYPLRPVYAPGISHTWVAGGWLKPPSPALTDSVMWRGINGTSIGFRIAHDGGGANPGRIRAELYASNVLVLQKSTTNENHDDGNAHLVLVTFTYGPASCSMNIWSDLEGNATASLGSTCQPFGDGYLQAMYTSNPPSVFDELVLWAPDNPFKPTVGSGSFVPADFVSDTVQIGYGDDFALRVERLAGFAKLAAIPTEITDGLGYLFAGVTALPSTLTAALQNLGKWSGGNVWVTRKGDVRIRDWQATYNSAFSGSYTLPQATLSDDPRPDLSPVVRVTKRSRSGFRIDRVLNDITTKHQNVFASGAQSRQFDDESKVKYGTKALAIDTELDTFLYADAFQDYPAMLLRRFAEPVVEVGDLTIRPWGDQTATDFVVKNLELEKSVHYTELPSGDDPHSLYREIRTDNPVAYWRFNETNYTDGVYDEIRGISTHTGSFGLAPYPQLGVTSLSTDRTDMSFRFSASTQSISFTDSADLEVSNTGMLSVECLVSASNTVTGTIISKGRVTPEWILAIVFGQYVWQIYNTSNAGHLTATGGSVGGNDHVVGTYDSSSTTARLYVNGVLAATDTTTTGTRRNNSTNGCEIGAINAASFYTGILDEVAVYNTVLTADRVAKHYEAVQLPTTPLLIDGSFAIQRESWDWQDGTDWTVTVGIAPIEEADRTIAFAVPHTDMVHVVPTPTRVTTSSSYVNFPDTSSVTFTKLRSDTDLVLSMWGSSYVSVTSTSTDLALQINGTDHQVAYLFHNTINEHASCNGINSVTGLAAGTYVVQLRWRRFSGTGTVSCDGADPISWTVTETL